ncbi:MAG TPA: peptide-methionine (S)-S-oxide reductase MsrA [Gemmatimonadaceae bacterium]|nr:peptide-methionine (S)-S-oxide reductase MsrA [Gemmatimonadaceae bacterium]
MIFFLQTDGPMLTSLARLLVVAPIATLLACSGSSASAATVGAAVPVPAPDAPAIATGVQTAVFAGGCFWGVDAVFKHVKGVTRVVSGYAGGAAETARYEDVGSGQTGHAEAVEVTYDPAIVSYGTLLKVFFTVAHDPTELNRQGPDEGTQYRSTIFVANDAQRTASSAYIAELTKAGTYRRPIVTTLESLTKFHPAEAYHQDYLALHPTQPYIVINDLPKLAALKARMPELYTGS